jgi:hypothetical protein
MKQIIRILKSAVTLILAGMLSWQTCFAQVDPWERVKLVEPGKKLSVKLHSGKSVNGKMETWSADGVAVRQGKDRVVQVAKSDVAQVEMVSGLSRGRKALIAFLVAGGTGVTAMAIDCAGHRSGEVCGKGGDGVAVFALTGGFAALIASLFPQHKEVIYTALPSAPATGAPRD